MFHAWITDEGADPMPGMQYKRLKLVDGVAGVRPSRHFVQSINLSITVVLCVSVEHSGDSGCSVTLS